MLLGIVFGLAGPFFGLGLPELIIIGIPVAIIVLIVVMRKARKTQGHEQERIERYAEKYDIPIEEFYPPETPSNQESQNPTHQPLPQEQAYTFPSPQGIPQNPAYSTDASTLNEIAPVLQTWKTSVGFSVLGLFVGFPVLLAISMILAVLLTLLFSLLASLTVGDTVATTLSSVLMRSSSGASPLLVIIGNSLMITYALRVYPSYFTDKPVFKSSKVISFANFTFGAVIFGALWNTNLTEKKKGVSYIVSAIGSGLSAAQFLFGIILALVTLFGSVSATATSTFQSYSAGTNSDERPTDMSAIVPLPELKSDWQRVAISNVGTNMLETQAITLE